MSNPFDRMMGAIRPRLGLTFSVDLTASGNTELVAVAADQRLFLYYLEYSSGGAALITVAIRFGAAGSLVHKSYLKEGGMALRNLIQAEMMGGFGESLYGNLSATGTVSIMGRYILRTIG